MSDERKSESKDLMTITEALEIIDNMAESADVCFSDDPEDEEMGRRAEALNLAWQALNDVLEQQGGKG